VKLNVSQLRRAGTGTQRYRFEESFPSISLGEEQLNFLSPFIAEIELCNTGKSLLAKGRINAEITVSCSKCLKEFQYKLNFDFEDEFYPAEFTPEDKDGAFIFDKDEFPIDERIMEHILLHLPMRFVCSDSCKGLCPKCGVDLNLNSCRCAEEDIDPRLEILSKWNKGV